LPIGPSLTKGGQMGYLLESNDEAKRLEFQAKQRSYLLEGEMQILSKLPLAANASVLDAGCGTGLVSRFIKKVRPDLFLEACDFADIRLKQGDIFARAEGISDISFFKANLEQIERADASYDLIVSRYVFEHLLNPQAVAHELFRLARPGGSICLIDFDGIFANFYTPNKEVMKMLNKIMSVLEFDLFIGRKLPTLLHCAGFSNIEWEVSTSYFKGDELKEEYENCKERLSFARPKIVQALGSDGAADQFTKLYLEEMQRPHTTLFYNKFITQGYKKF